ncbi:MAG TPA: hypothetical protein VMH27_20745 [Puia sp.]|nr:hypothetical protein [Puia sp.]
MNLRTILLLGLIAGTVAGVMAYLITYNEYQHHFKGRRVVIESLKSAAVAFLFFLALTIVLCLLLDGTPARPAAAVSLALPNKSLIFLNSPVRSNQHSPVIFIE